MRVQSESTIIALVGGPVAVAASLPSGADEVVEARADLELRLAEAGTLPTFHCDPQDLYRVCITWRTARE